MTTKLTTSPMTLAALLPTLNIIEATENAGTAETYTGSSPEGTLDIVSYRNSIAPVTVVLTGTGATNAGASATGWAADDSYTAIDGIEGTSANDTFYGNAQDNFFIGGGGADTFHGGDGIDTISYQNAANGVLIDIGYGTTGVGEAFGDRVYSIENIIGSNYNDIIIGGSDNNKLEGGNGNDTINGSSSYYNADTGVGGDTIDGGDGIDTVSYAYAVSSNVTVDLSLTGRQTGSDSRNDHAAGDLLISIENVIGTKWADNITGNDADNVIDGGMQVDNSRIGFDTMAGKGGNDTYFVNASIDGAVDLVIEELDQGTDLVYTEVSYALTANVENLIALEGEWSAVSLTGNNLANFIIGNEANNVINGGTGADRMQGGLGNDIYYVDNAWDSVAENIGGGTSDHVLTYVSHKLGANVERLTALGSSAVSLTGNTLANVITGNAGANTINGDKGNDLLKGGAGRDVFVFSTVASAYNKDKILDWNYRDDTIKLENAIFTKLKAGGLASSYFRIGAKALDSNDFVGYNKATGDLWYDSNGSKAGGQVVFANIGANKIIYHTDFIVF